MARRDAFCNPRIYRQVFFENEHFIAAYNIRPMLPGHILVIPKRHVLEILELTDEEMVSLLSILKKVVPIVLEKFGADAYNFSINGGTDAGEAVKHLHIHIVPRKKGDAFHGNVMRFYRRLEEERVGYDKDVPNQIKRLKKIFKYKPVPRKAV